MSCDPIFTVWCDLDDPGTADAECDHWCEHTAQTRLAARDNARAVGWRRARIDGRLVDVCPTHVAAGATR